MKHLYTLIIIFFSLQSFAVPPTVPASNLSFNAVDGGFFNIGWTAGNGTKRIIICKAGSPVNFTPQNGVDYTANTVFGSGQQVAAGEFVVYNSAFTSFFLTNLTPATQYFFAVFEYNGSGATTEYLTANFLTGNAFTSATPTTQTSNANFTNITTNSVTFTWTNGNGQRRLIVVRQGAAVNANPVMSHQYNVSAVFGNGEATGTGNFTVYASSDDATTVTNLLPNTQYFFAFYEFNGSGQPQYLTPAYTASVTTRSIPTIPSSNMILTKRDGKELTFSWTNGNGQRRIIIAKKANDITSIPVNGTDYNANAVFGTGQQLNTGEFVVYDDNFNAATISGLEPATTYFFKIFEYDGTGANTMYLTSTFAASSAMTATTPTIQTTAVTATNITSNSMDLIFTNGNGRARIVIARKNVAVNVVLQNFTVYAGDEIFGNGQDLGNGNFVITNTVDNAVGVQNLEPNSTYHFAIFEFNGFNQPLYLSPAVIFNATTLGTVPVKLKSFTATVIQKKAKLNWITATEINSKNFVIERSADAINFFTIATVQATGAGGIETPYETIDQSPLPGISYYRLKMVDNDERFEYSPVRMIDLGSNQLIFASGNPVHHTLEVVNIEATGNDNKWQIVNVQGQVVKNGIIKNGAIKVYVNDLPTGTYWLRLSNPEKIKSLPFIKQ